MENKARLYPVAVLMLPVMISFWLLGAHFLRNDSLFWCLILAAFPLLLLIRRPLAARVIQLSLVLAAMAWLRITYLMLMARLMMGDDWQRLVLIMGGVICFTLLSACCFLHSKAECHYGLNSPQS